MQNKLKRFMKTPWMYLVVFLIILGVVSIISMPGASVTKEISYSSFLQLLRAGGVEAVQIEGDLLTIKPVPSANTDQPVYYTARIVENDALVSEMQRVGVDFAAVEKKESMSILDFIVVYGMPLLMIGILLYWIVMIFKNSRKGGEGGGGFGAFGFAKSSAKLFDLQECTTRFEDVAGQDEAKESLIEIVDILKNPGRYTSVGAEIPKGALLVGPPGTGKTLLAKAVAGEASVPFFFVSGSAFVEMFVGTGAARVRDLFRQASQKAPCIVFIDEIDAIGKKRDSIGLSGNDEREQTLNQLLAEMDGFDPEKGIMVLAATNRPEILDKALLRPGRFDRRIPVELPDMKGREDILRVHARKKVLEPEVNLKRVADATPGASGAELANILNEAALCAVRDHRSMISQ
ncbi:MAG: ATP-dependent metallopeptidase FtsH/Yme1/Tma family protein, partial [Christensenellales bacterium]|nr:ATP-dependent metallopeptidase FtsH/Yme1/Tma family protein [Christensenellales bacterium]